MHDATESDLQGVVEIYNEVIANSTAVFANLPVTVDERRRWWQARTAQGYPVLIAHDEQGVAAFGSFGTQLLRALIARAGALGKHVMIAGVDADNAASIRLHERLGFTRAGRLCAVGYKFDRWLDLVFLQRAL